MTVRKNSGWARHELYYDEANKEAYVVHTVKDDKLDTAKQHMENFKALGKRTEMKPSGNPDHSIIPEETRLRRLHIKDLVVIFFRSIME
jgi:hypothetical protein